MARVKITFEYNNTTGKRVIHIDYQSDKDALAFEHEKEHARIVRELIGKGVITEKDAEDVIIDRPQPKRAQDAVEEPGKAEPRAKEN